MIERIIKTFEKPSSHKASSEIIRRYSANKEDVREVALSDLDLTSVKDVLDLGCGFGFMTQFVSKRVAPNATIIGVDACSENMSVFIETVKAAGREAGFKHFQIIDKLPYPDNSFDLVIASYSLYFFVETISEIARVLRPEGMFITITHFQDSFSGLYRAADFSEVDTPLAKLISKFSAENGEEKLTVYFDDIEHIEYRNILHFEKGDIKDLLEYVRFKLPLMALGPDLHDRSTDVKLPTRMERIITETLMTDGEVNIKKWDAIFRCRRPKCH